MLRFPRELLREAGRRGIKLRYPHRSGGRAMDWVSTSLVMDEAEKLGYGLACVFGVGAEMECDTIVLNGTCPRHENCVLPLLRSRIDDSARRIPG